jgi:peptidoglycan DL-endopeptidase CwlO
MKHSTVSVRPLRTIGTFAVAVALSVAMTPATSFAAPSDDKQAEAQAALAQLNEMQTELETAENTYYAAVQAREEAQTQVENAQSRIDEASARIDELQTKLGSRARAMYRSGASTILDVLLGSTSFEEFASNWDMLDMLNKNDAAMTQESKDLRSEVEAQKVILEEQARAAEKAEAEANEIRANAEATVNQMAEVYNNLSAEAAELLEQERAAQAAAEAEAAQAVVDASAEGATNDDGDDGDGGSSYSEPEYNAVTGNAIVDRAYSYVGNAEYVWGACSPGAFDCSGFVSYCLTGAYSRLGTTYTFLGWPQVSDPQPGDVAVNEGHCGIYIGGGQMIHCATYGVGVIIGPVQSGMTIHRW